MKTIRYRLFSFAIVFSITSSFCQQISTREELDQYFQENQNKNTYAQFETFDPEALNYDRFKNSPCFDKIGFNPTWDMSSLENEYSDCEQEHYFNLIFKVIIGLIFLIVLIVVVFFSLPQEKRKKILKNIPKP
jgi:hypothetical protein